MALTNGQTRETLANDMWQACKILRRDNNCGGVMEYIEHLAWLLFLRFLMPRKRYGNPKRLWRAKRINVSSKATWPGRTGHARLAGRRPDPVRSYPPDPKPAELHGDPFRETISSIFSERNVVVCASGYNLKDVLKLVDEIDFLNQDDVYTVSHVYETLLKRLGNENKVAGEFYTPRPIIRFMWSK